MEWVVAHIESIAAGFAAVSAAWAFLLKADRSIKNHLRDEFATKEDLNAGLGKLENKLDRVLLLAFQTKEYNREDKLKLL